MKKKSRTIEKYVDLIKALILNYIEFISINSSWMPTMNHALNVTNCSNCITRSLDGLSFSFIHNISFFFFFSLPRLCFSRVVPIVLFSFKRKIVLFCVSLNVKQWKKIVSILKWIVQTNEPTENQKIAEAEKKSNRMRRRAIGNKTNILQRVSLDRWVNNRRWKSLQNHNTPPFVDSLRIFSRFILKLHFYRLVWLWRRTVMLSVVIVIVGSFTVLIYRFGCVAFELQSFSSSLD